MDIPLGISKDRELVPDDGDHCMYDFHNIQSEYWELFEEEATADSEEMLLEETETELTLETSDSLVIGNPTVKVIRIL